MLFEIKFSIQQGRGESIIYKAATGNVVLSERRVGENIEGEKYSIRKEL